MAKKKVARLANGVKTSLKSGNIIKTNTKNLYRIKDSCISMLLLSNFSEFKSVSFLCEINPSSIESIYFGARVSKKDIYNIFNKIKDEGHPLNHVNLHALSLSKIRFELIRKTVDDSFFS